jgi:hypothetical protein
VLDLANTTVCTVIGVGSPGAVAGLLALASPGDVGWRLLDRRFRTSHGQGGTPIPFMLGGELGPESHPRQELTVG